MAHDTSQTVARAIVADPTAHVEALVGAGLIERSGWMHPPSPHRQAYLIVRPEGSETGPAEGTSEWDHLHDQKMLTLHNEELRALIRAADHAIQITLKYIARAGLMSDQGVNRERQKVADAIFAYEDTRDQLHNVEPPRPSEKTDFRS